MLVENKKKNIFLVAGRTGGPYFPIPKIASVLDEYNPIVIGVKNSFEQKICTTENLELVYLPEAKLNLFSFSKSSLLDKLYGFFDLIWNLLKLKFSFWICVFQILKYKPVLIYTTGSFLAVPLFVAAKILNLLHLTSIRLVVHQQDPLVGLSNKICVKIADLSSCTFDYTKQNFKDFQSSFLIQNPILESKFEPKSNWKLRDLQNFVSDSQKPTILIFGGGSGAKFINDWVWNNLQTLTSNFSVIHLTGILQEITLKMPKTENYFSLDAVFEDMPQLLRSVEFVMCRAGLGTISELQFLNKKAFLVPLPDSHQELNAELVKDEFVILEQKKSETWLDIILNDGFFGNKVARTKLVDNNDDYFDKLASIID
jgi:UDP-N-acetylglucosamine--N-acetylmuramyl-(pentapeptide) pyrophosphoryl-undecaprenol N-acetylglucosamine transferase